MHILIDIAIVLIIAAAVWIGYRKGFILGLCGILAIVVAFYGANLVSSTYYEEFTPILEPFVGGLIDDSVSKTLSSSDGATDELNDQFIYEGETDTETGVYTVALMALGRFGIAESAADSIAKNVSAQVEAVNANFRSTLTDILCGTITKVLAFIIVFMLIMIIFTVISNLLNLQLRVPGLDIINNFIGAGVGLVKAWFIVSLIAWVMRYSTIFISGEVVQKTVILEFFMNHNIISSILGM